MKVRELDVIKLHRGLEHRYGLDAAWMSRKTRSRGVGLLSPTGLPVNVGWFNNNARVQGSFSEDVHALTTYPHNPRHMRHRLIISQVEGRDRARIYEEDDDMYLEGIDNFTEIISSEFITQPKLSKLVTLHALGCVVLRPDVGESVAKTSLTGSTSETRETGLGIIDRGDYLGRIDVPFLRECVSIERVA